MSEEMRKAMDEVRTDTNDVTGATEPRATDDELAVAISTLSKHAYPKPSRYPRPGWLAYLTLCFFILLGGVGFLLSFQKAQQDRLAQCERVNVLRSRLVNILTLAEATVPAEEYTKEVKDFYTASLSDLSLTDCSKIDNKPKGPVQIPKRAVREPGQPSPPMSGQIGPTGATGGTGAQGIPGIAGRSGSQGPIGPQGSSGPPGSRTAR